MSFIENIDLYFSTKKKSEKWMVILMLVGSIFYLFYTYLLPYSKGMYEKSKEKQRVIKQSIAMNEKYLNHVNLKKEYRFNSQKLNKEIINKKQKIDNIQNKIVLIDDSLKKVSDMLFNQKSWSVFLNSITNKATKHHVDIEYISNEYRDNNDSLSHILKIAIGCKGSYKNLVKFMNALEQNNLITNIYETKFELNKNRSKIFADINISIWGIDY